jgi:hypothetical protein
MSRASDAFTDHVNSGFGGNTQIQPDKCMAVKVEKAVAFLTEQGFTVVATQSNN